MSPLLVLGIGVVCSLWVYQDACRNLPDVENEYPRRKMQALNWAAGTLLFWILVFPVYLVFRARFSRRLSS